MDDFLPEFPPKSQPLPRPKARISIGRKVFWSVLAFAMIGCASVRIWQWQAHDAWQREQEGIARFRSRDVTFKTEQVLPSWLLGEEGERVVEAQQIPPQTVYVDTSDPIGLGKVEIETEDFEAVTLAELTPWFPWLEHLYYSSPGAPHYLRFQRRR